MSPRIELERLEMVTERSDEMAQTTSIFDRNHWLSTILADAFADDPGYVYCFELDVKPRQHNDHVDLERCECRTPGASPSSRSNLPGRPRLLDDGAWWDRQFQLGCLELDGSVFPSLSESSFLVSLACHAVQRQSSPLSPCAAALIPIPRVA